MKRLPDVLAPSLAEDWPELPVVRAQGAYLYTADGRRYLDFTSGIGVTNVGHCHPRVLEAASRQMHEMAHSAVGVTVHKSLLELCDALTAVLPPKMDMFFFGNSGAEAVEGALKLARYVSQRPGIIAFEGGFHGRSYGAASVTSVKSKYRDHYEPFVPGVYFVPYPYAYRCPLGDTPEAALDWTLMSLRRLFQHQIPPSQVAAFLVEPVQGEGGYIVPPRDFLPALRRICDEHGIYLILDEVQCGFGRTGEMFAAQVFDVQPDIMAIAKGIASGFPLGATVASRDLMRRWKVWRPWHHIWRQSRRLRRGSGDPAGDRRRRTCWRMLAAWGSASWLVCSSLQAQYPAIGEARGLGLMLAMEMIVPGSDKEPDPRASMDLLNLCLERGLLAYMAGTFGQVVRFIPPLIVTAEQVDQALNILDEALSTISPRS